MGGCIGCCSLPAHLLSTDEPGKGLRGQHQPVRKPSILEDFWSTTSTCEMDNGTALQSQRSISSINTSNQTFDPLSGTGSTSNSTEFVNHGFLLWKQVREQWLGNKKSEKRSAKGREPRLRWHHLRDRVDQTLNYSTHLFSFQTIFSLFSSTYQMVRDTVILGQNRISQHCTSLPHLFLENLVSSGCSLWPSTCISCNHYDGLAAGMQHMKACLVPISPLPGQSLSLKW